MPYGTSEGFSSPKILESPGGSRVRGLQKCNWVFWHEPDDTNFGPQIMVTEPNGTTHYLVDKATLWDKLHQHTEQHAATRGRSPMPSGSESTEAFVDDEDYYSEKEEETPVVSAQVCAPTAPATWASRLRGGIAQRWRIRSSRGWLSLRSACSLPEDADVLEASNIAGLHDAWSDRRGPTLMFFWSVGRVTSQRVLLQ